MNPDISILLFQLGIGHTTTIDSLEKVGVPKSFGSIKMVRCGDWGTAVVVQNKAKK